MLERQSQPEVNGVRLQQKVNAPHVFGQWANRQPIYCGATLIRLDAGLGDPVRDERQRWLGLVSHGNCIP